MSTRPLRAPRRFFCGPGILNTDLTLLKKIPLGSSRVLQLRWETFNVFDHPQFYGAARWTGTS